eukprot:522884-Prymnesium_polylepis.1
MTTYIILVCPPCPTFAPLLPVPRVPISPPVRLHVRLALSRPVTHSLTGLALHTLAMDAAFIAVFVAL